MEYFRSLGNALYPEHPRDLAAAGPILDHWEMRSIRNSRGHKASFALILDHWEMRSSKSSSQYIPIFIYFR